MNVILASRSPRRRELMARVNPDFHVQAVEVDETAIRETDPVRFAVEAAVLKARACGDLFPSSLVIGADTVVALGSRILGKPADRAGAASMLRLLSGRRHRVITGVALYNKESSRLLTGFELTYVTFRDLTDAMVDGYLDRNDYLDKAGAYAVQDVGDAFVLRLKGDFDNVVGFPVRMVRRMIARFMSPEVPVTVEEVAIPGGFGIARRDGRPLLIPGTVPGDEAEVRIMGESRGAPMAELCGLLRPSPLREEPRCPHFGECGGCLFQHLKYEEQLRIKERYLLKTLREAGGITLPEAGIAPISASPEIYDYRNKMEFAFGEKDGSIILGLRERESPFALFRGGVVSLRTCPIFGSTVEAIFPAALDFSKEKGLTAYIPRRRTGCLRHLVIRRAKASSELMIILVTRGEEAPDFAELAESLAGRLPGLKSFFHVRNDRVSDVVTFEGVELLAGRPYIEERLAGLTFRIRPQTFFQTNTRAAGLLYEKIVESAGVSGESRVLGLYCGAGPIEIALARIGARVVGIDSSPANIANAVENTLLNRAAGCRFIPGFVEKTMRTLPNERWDVLVLDPPRVGLSQKAMKHALALKAPRILYISCNPAALARDLKLFLGAGYSLESLAPFDFFPHTPHLEALAVLRKT